MYRYFRRTIMQPCMNQSLVYVYIYVLESFLLLTGNNRSALNDASAARKLEPAYMKAILRGECTIELHIHKTVQFKCQ